MPRLTLNSLDRVASALPGWMFLLAGVAAIAATLIMPEWLQVRDLAWQRDVMKAQAERFREQKDAYAGFDLALREDDPVLIERLAFTELRLKPLDSDFVLVSGGQQAASPWVHAVSDLGPAAPSPSAPGSLEQWLQKPLPTAGVDIPRPREIRSRLVRLTTGPKRLGLIVAAFICLIGGVWWCAPSGTTKTD